MIRVLHLPGSPFPEGYSASDVDDAEGSWKPGEVRAVERAVARRLCSTFPDAFDLAPRELAPGEVPMPPALGDDGDDGDASILDELTLLDEDGAFILVEGDPLPEGVELPETALLDPDTLDLSTAIIVPIEGRAAPTLPPEGLPAEKSTEVEEPPVESSTPTPTPTEAETPAPAQPTEG